MFIISNRKIDCLFIGNNQMVFSDYVRSVRKMGERSGAFRDLNLHFVEEDEKILSLSDVYNQRHGKDDIYGEMGYNDILSATIAYLATFISEHGFTFDYINSFQEEKDYLREILTSCEVGAVAVTTTYYVSVLPILEIMKFIKDCNEEVKIIIGGPFIANQLKTQEDVSADYLLNQIGADFYINDAQGETALVGILGSLQHRNPFDAVNNIIYRLGDVYCPTKREAEINNLEHHPVNWNLFRDKQKRMVSVRTAVSCPYSCAFCGFPENAGKYYCISPQRVFQELDQIEGMGCVKSVNFLDDTFNVPMQRFKEILKEIIRRKYKFRWNSHFRCQYADREVVDLMKESGCDGVFLGIESGNQEILNNMNKKSKLDDYYKGMELLREYGIMTYASFIVGFPGETRNTVQDTINFIQTAKPDFYRTQLWYYDLTTPIHREKAKYELENSQFEWSHKTMNSEEAADLVDSAFLNIKDSVWLPQNNFDYPGLFNLLSRGWDKEKIKSFIGSFNERIKEKESMKHSHTEYDLGFHTKVNTEMDTDIDSIFDAVDFKF